MYLILIYRDKFFNHPVTVSPPCKSVTTLKEGESGCGETLQCLYFSTMDVSDNIEGRGTHDIVVMCDKII